MKSAIPNKQKEPESAGNCQQVAITKPKWKSITADQATVIERNHGHQVVYPENPPLAVSQNRSNTT